MDVEKSKSLDEWHSLEIGGSTWNPEERSVRRRCNMESGQYDPHSSSEIPLYAVSEIIEFLCENQCFSAKECVELSQVLLDSARSQMKK
jgi:hypothetical protein